MIHMEDLEIKQKTSTTIITFFVFFFFLFLSTQSYAHGIAKYISTPITPPAEFIWWLPVSLLLLFVFCFILIHKYFLFGWKKSFLCSIAIIPLFAISFFLFGLFASSITTAPLPGLGGPCPTFWGIGWREGGFLFLRWNIYGFLFLFLSSLLITNSWKNKTKLKYGIALFLVYSMCLLPYIITGALLHGWTGYYAHSACDRRIKVLTQALIAYMEDNNGQIPDVYDFQEISGIIKVYITYESLPYKTFPLEVCPVGGVYERNPQQYEWNEYFTGKSFQSFDLTDDAFILNGSPFICPYHNSAASYFKEYWFKNYYDKKDE